MLCTLSFFLDLDRDEGIEMTILKAMEMIAMLCIASVVEMVVVRRFHERRKSLDVVKCSAPSLAFADCHVSLT